MYHYIIRSYLKKIFFLKWLLFVKQTIAEVEANSKISVHLDAEVKKTDGFVGNFKTTLSNDDSFEHGVIVIATGGMEYKPDE